MDAHPVRWVFVVGLVFTLALLNVKLFAGSGPWWRGWADQKAYLESARAFGALDLSPGRHWYPLVYPLLAAPFAWLLAAPFVPANLACFGLAFAGFRSVAGRFGIGGAGALVLFLATTLLDPAVAPRWLEPWTTTLSAALVWPALALTGALIFRERLGPGRAALLGALLALIPLTRPADLIVTAALAPFILWRADWRERGIGLGAGLAILLLYLGLHLAIYGARWSDYVLLSRAYGLNFGDLAFKAQVLLVDARGWFPGGKSLLEAMPWLFFAALGFALGGFTLRGPARMLWVCMALVATSYTLVLIAYVDLLPTGMWRFNNIHYFKWLLPMAGLGIVRLWQDAPGHRRTGLAIAALLFAATLFHLQPVPAGEHSPARALRFAAAPQPWAEIYMARSAIADARGIQRNFFDYHQIPDGGRGVLAVALKRPFEGDARWIGNPPLNLADWPRGSPGQRAALAGPFPRHPYARLTGRWTLGPPCWLIAPLCD